MDKEVRYCSRPGCNRVAVATLTYVYSDSTAVLGPLSTQPEPHTWDLCAHHTARFTAPKGWELVRSEIPIHTITTSSREEDDLTALAEAVKEASGSGSHPPSGSFPKISHPKKPSLSTRTNPHHQPVTAPRVAKKTPGRRGHLRLLPDPD